MLLLFLDLMTMTATTTTTTIGSGDEQQAVGPDNATCIVWAFGMFFYTLLLVSFAK